MLIRISPDGSEVKHLHNDKYFSITSKHADVTVERASDVFFDNEIKRWRIRMGDHVVDDSFETRQEAIEHEIAILETQLRYGVV